MSVWASSDAPARGQYARLLRWYAWHHVLAVVTSGTDEKDEPMHLGWPMIDWGIFGTSLLRAVVKSRVRMVQTLMAELKVLIGKRIPPPSAPIQLTYTQPHYTRRDLKANLHRHMSIVLDRSVMLVWCHRY